ncbi:unnamed protein product [Lymnaea stagnalis]|uniref:Ig-like domain-containing protein n=1 Tax=Lymnaea stagnalis TaxID=6523 RepID=A0AAV2HKT3_LYMST
MTLFILRLLPLLTIVDVSMSLWSMEGKAQTYKVAINNVAQVISINWIFQNGNSIISLFQCSSVNDMRCDISDNQNLDLYSATVTSNSSSYISLFTIKNVSMSLHNTRWLFNADSTTNPSFHETSTFDLQVFSAAESPTCDDVELVNESNLQIYCWTKKVFPGSYCLFNVKTNISSEYELKQGHISYTQEQNLTTLYYKTTCTLVVSAAVLGPGSHMFRVVMYPNITSDITEEMKSTSNYTIAIYLGYPRALLGTDCEVQGYVMENKQSNCTCLDINNSFLPTQINWLTNKSIIFRKETLFFTAKRKQSFLCTISNHLNWTDQVYFLPNISYPPDTLWLNMTKQVFDLCNDTNIFISGTCFVSESNPEPSVTVNINISSMDITSLKHENLYIFNKTMASTGFYNISCLANSKEYSKNVSSITTTMTVKGPSGVPNIFINKNEGIKSKSNNMIKITEGDTIVCQSKGGYPILKNISLKCGPEETSATNQDQVSMIFNISNVTNGKCECMVWQESRCLQNTATVNFIVEDLETSPVKGQYFEKMYIGVGVTAGGLVVIISLIFISHSLHQRLLKKTSR